MKQTSIILILSLLKLTSCYNFDTKCFDDNFGNVTSSGDQGSPQVRLNLKHHHKSQFLHNQGTLLIRQLQLDNLLKSYMFQSNFGILFSKILGYKMTETY